jgi:hypothetical protein
MRAKHVGAVRTLHAMEARGAAGQTFRAAETHPQHLIRFAPA